MVITTTYDVFQKAVIPLKAVIMDKVSSDNIRNVIVIVKEDGSVNLAAFNTIVTSFAPLSDASVTWAEGETPAETWFQMKSDVLRKLDGFKSGSRTAMGTMTIEPHGDTTYIQISEHAVAADIPDERKANYNSKSKLRIPSPKLNDGIKKKMQEHEVTISGEELNSVDVKLYLDTLAGTIPADAKDAQTTRIMLKGDDIYTAPSVYVAVMQNKLPSVKFRDFVLSSSATGFIRAYAGCTDKFSFDKTENENAVMLKFSCPDCIAFVVAQLPKNILDCTKSKKHSNTGIAIDKEWFLSQLNRVGANGEFSLKVKIYATHGSYSILSREYSARDVQALRSRLDPSEFNGMDILKTDDNGEQYAEFSLDMRANVLTKLLFAGTTFNSPAFCYFEAEAGMLNQPPAIYLAVTDDTQIWQTKTSKLITSRTDFAWEE